MRMRIRELILQVLMVLLVSGAARAQQPLQDVLQYIAAGWGTLTRSMDNCATVVDTKMPPGRSVLYLPAGMTIPASVDDLARKCNIHVEHLPVPIQRPGTIDTNKLRPQGLLLLPNSYVVPGGFFNEMYGWDSYFIILGLLRDGKSDLARGMVENFFFEIENYGAVLNANRTYFLTRSQPPFLTSMILAVYEAQKAAGKEDKQWLARAYKDAAKDYEMWTREPHLAGETGLSRYYDFGNGPVLEVSEGRDPYYRDVAAYFVAHPEAALPYIADNNADTPTFSVQACQGEGPSAPETPCKPVRSFALTPDYYKGDRSMRESGFDISFRFGPFSAETHHYAPVCLNSLLFKTEKDMERISTLLGNQSDTQQWAQRAKVRQAHVNQHLWDAGRGLFVDYNFYTHGQSSYEYVTTFYPLWAGLATPEQARAVVQNLSLFEQPGGLAMSRHETKVQWDYPYGWAPNQLLAVEGLRRYGFHAEANRIAFNFISTVAENFRRDGTIREKYNVVTRSSETQVEAGYQMNVVGFGWTNGVFLELLHSLPQEWVSRLEPPKAQAATSK